MPQPVPLVADSAEVASAAADSAEVASAAADLAEVASAAVGGGLGEVGPASGREADLGEANQQEVEGLGAGQDEGALEGAELRVAAQRVSRVEVEEEEEEGLEEGLRRQGAQPQVMCEQQRGGLKKQSKWILDSKPKNEP